MSKTVPNCNRSFIIEALLENKRLDGRSLHQFRDLQVNYGQTFGSCYVQLGHTVIFASTEATVDEPRLTRPAEGRFKVSMNICAGGKEKWLRNIERSQPKEGVLTMRLLEKIINRINVLDLESLCLVVGRSVWCINTKLVLLNYDGNLTEAASIATIASLMHFRRPDATVTPDGDIIVHSMEERNPIPLTLFHYPICVTFQFMDHTLLKRIISENQELFPAEHSSRVRKAMQLMICDPTEEEEDFLKNVLVVCANTYREIVTIQSLGRISLTTFSKQLLSDCTLKAFDRVKFVTDYLKQELEKHNQSPMSVASLKRNNFYEAMENGELCIVKNYMRHSIFGKGNTFTLPPRDEDMSVKDDDKNNLDEEVSIFLRSQRRAHNNVGQGGMSKWGIESAFKQEFDDDEEEDDDDEEDNQKTPKELESKSEKSFATMLGSGNGLQKALNVPKAQPVASNLQTKQTNIQNLPPETQKTNDWIKVSTKKVPPKQELQLSKSQKKKMQRKKANQPPLPAHLMKKIAEPISSDDDDVEMLNSEFSKK